MLNKIIHAVLIVSIGLWCFESSKEEPKEIEPECEEVYAEQEKYTSSFVMEIGGYYKCKIASNGEIIKKCDASVRAKTITFITEDKQEINEYKNLDISTISLYNTEKTSCMILSNETNNAGGLKFTFIGTVTEDITGSYDLVYKGDTVATSKVDWTLTGEALETNRVSGENALEDRDIYMCIAQDKNGESYVRIYADELWKTYTFSVLGKTIYLTEILL